MARIFKRKDGRYAAEIPIGHGKRKTVYAHTRKECAEKIKALEHELAYGVAVDAKKQTLQQFLDQWLTDVAKEQCRKNTYAGYKTNLDKHIIPKLGHIPLKQLTPQHIQPVINRLAKTLEPRTVRNIRATLRHALNTAVEWRLLVYNPATVVKMPKIEKYTPHILAPDEAHTFIEAIRDHRLGLLIRTAIYTGMREGEIIGLLRENVDTAACVIHVTGAVQYIDGKRQRVATKSNAGVRDVPIPASLARDLAAHLATHAHPYVFVTKHGTPYNKSNLLRDFKALLRKHNMPIIRFHDLRHGCATYLLRTENVKTVQQHLGHADVTTTLGIYAHVLEDDHRQAVNRLDELLG